MSKTVILLGSDHYNAIGIVQCLGREGFSVIAVIRGKKKGSLIAASRFLTDIYEADDFNQAIDIIATQLVQEQPTVIIPCGDEAALVLEQNSERLKGNFIYQHSSKDYPLSMLMNKHIQASLASECGFHVPQSIEVNSKLQPDCNIELPCIIKPLLSCEGDKMDICIANSKFEMQDKVNKLLTRSPRVLVQHFIGSGGKTELNILGCGLNNGNCIVPLCIEKVRVHPSGTGSVSLCKVKPFSDYHSNIIENIKKLINKIGYIGLFSIELLCENDSGKIFFIEMNLRNDALNSFIAKSGVNLPLIHYSDITGQLLPDYKPVKKEQLMICEPIHLSSMLHGGISIIEWTRDIINSDSFILYDSKDKKVFFLQFIYKIRDKIKKLLP